MGNCFLWLPTAAVSSERSRRRAADLFIVLIIKLSEFIAAFLKGFYKGVGGGCGGQLFSKLLIVSGTEAQLQVIGHKIGYKVLLKGK